MALNSALLPVLANVCKLAECLALNRMYWIIQKNKLIGEDQAGFQKHRCIEDQIIRIQQKVLDGFNSARSRNARSKRTLMVLFDFSKAFNKVWKDGLLWKLIQKGLPMCMIKWIREYLSGRELYVGETVHRVERKASNTGYPRQEYSHRSSLYCSETTLTTLLKT